MKLSKTMLSAGIVTAVTAGSITGVNAVSAHTNDGVSKDALIDRVAADAGVDRSVIEASFESHQEDMKAEREATRAEHLDQLVTDSTLTQEQREALELKFEELKSQKESLRDQDLSREQKRELMKESREEFKAWAEKQGINLDDIRPEKGEGFGRKGHGHRHHHDATEES